MPRDLISVLLAEKADKISGGIYNKLQVDFAYNSNHIEGSKLTHEQTRYIYETQTVGIEPARVDDVFETVNHFRCFDKIIDTYQDELTADYIKSLHLILKNSTLSSDREEAVVGDYKKYPNYVGDMQTFAPDKVAAAVEALLTDYKMIAAVDLYDILSFHADFEKIHPFYDGNGRIGRLLMFKECLKYDIVPFFIEDTYKGYYYKGLKEWQSDSEKGFLLDTCLMMQDRMKAILDYFKIEYDHTEITACELLDRSGKTR